jgi:putative nucleotidyltransferase with HDIG domain
MDSSHHTTLERPAPAARPREHAELALSDGCGDPRRMSHLFRRSLAIGAVHPLLPVLKRYHGVPDGLTMPAPAASPASVALPRARIGVDQLRRGVTTLPSLPQAVQDALAVLGDEGASVHAVAERIEHDQVLMARTLRAANTAFYGAPGRVATIRAAIGVLGLRAVAALLTTASVSAQFPVSARCPEFRFGSFWRHTLTTALTSRGLARALGMDAEVAFTAGLLHDIGALVLATQFPAEFGIALRHAREHDLPLRGAERAVLDVDHCVAGEVLAQHWRLPAAVVQAIAQHHAPVPDPRGKPSLSELVHVADALAHGIQAEDESDDAVPPVTVEVWARLGIGVPACLGVLQAASASVEALCEALSL